MQSTADLAVTTTREDFRALAAEHRVVPVTRKVLADSETPLSAYRKLAANRPGTFLLESAENGRSWSRWSFIGAGAPSALTVRDGQAAWLGATPQDAPSGGDPLQALHDDAGTAAHRSRWPALPPLSGGLVGFFAYDLVRRLERLPDAGGRRPRAARHGAAAGHRHRRRRPPRGHDHADRQRGELERHRRARRLGLRRRGRPAGRDDRGAGPAAAVDGGDVRPARAAAPRRSARSRSTARSSSELVGEIEAGEAFQVVPSQRFEMDTDADPIDVYRMLRVSNPSPYMYLLNMPDERWRT